MRRSLTVVVLAAVLVGLAIYLIGPRLLAPQSDTASEACINRYPNDGGATQWSFGPVAGWRCVTTSGDKYLAWWART